MKKVSLNSSNQELLDAVNENKKQLVHKINELDKRYNVMILQLKSMDSDKQKLKSLLYTSSVEILAELEKPMSDMEYANLVRRIEELIHSTELL